LAKEKEAAREIDFSRSASFIVKLFNTGFVQAGKPSGLYEACVI
jgi:hypothetical protein